MNGEIEAFVDTLNLDELVELQAVVSRRIEAHLPKQMRIVQVFRGYNEKRCSKPWIAAVTSWPVGRSPVLHFGEYLGTDAGGPAEILARPGDVVRWGQKDNRNENHTVANWGVVEADGSIRKCSKEEAREAFGS
ncbi:MAG: hypothetical protein RDU24_12920 [Humidesulfovibrio sp.]|uniref:hypothetical protein n=1 Tax=Humidesulfovibrio sp. TaxID=2910988 RepID=UPI0027FAD227|nr:hypothetical protein [Humidesulfovibrio sp.]MDQ7836277.1 hypothetical protein [Humidesulfovibrio sp.]